MYKKTYLLIYVFCLFGLISSYAQEKYFVAFCAKDGLPGHAFVSYGYESEDLMMTVHGGTWGLYPESKTMGVASFVIGEVPGGLRDDLITHSDHTYVIEVTEVEYRKVISIRNNWYEKNYEASKSDCVSFLIEVASIFKDKINLPMRDGLENFPARYLIALIDHNN